MIQAIIAAIEFDAVVIGLPCCFKQLVQVLIAAGWVEFVGIGSGFHGGVPRRAV